MNMKTPMDDSFLEQFQRQIDLARWKGLPAKERAGQLPAILAAWQSLFQVTAELRFQMPAGYEAAYGLFHPEKNVLYLNLARETGPVEQLFYLLHEFRHGVQYGHPEWFPYFLVESMRYMIQYDGTCYRVDHGQLLETKLDGEQAYFTQLYLCQPYERDANGFAFRSLKAAGKAQGMVLEGLDELFAMWSPRFQLFSEGEATAHLEEVYQRIDRQLKY